MAILTIGSVETVNPTEYKVTRSDLDTENTTRTEDGVLIRDRCRAGMYKIEATWTAITWAQLKAITDAVAPAGFNITFLNPFAGSTNTSGQFYCGDRTASCNTLTSEAGYIYSRWDLSVQLVQY